ncbi:phosphoribosyl transferase [Mycobacterium phage DroogsArmy]|uniref:Phosphoribosyl transferase n=1 Tax=Mycobacterium phage DroogsArmy TaxID=2744011 RepID=A0A6N0A6J8_9CAUD|nr:phosphoribosyl transferase [Mycobacterium phage DroogsArmy]QKO02458.1 phosphoribosyl transferase [Mycobacterium phage DroogsArmy]
MTRITPQRYLDSLDRIEMQARDAISRAYADDLNRYFGGGVAESKGFTKIEYQDIYSDVPQRIMQPPPAPKKPEPPKVLDLTDESYLRLAHDPERLVKIIEPHVERVEFDTLVGTGLSGTLATAAVAKALGKHYFIARKPNDGTHSGNRYGEGKLGARWVFLDDLIATGRTLGRVWDAVYQTSQRWNHTTEFVGAVLYGDGSWYTDKFISVKDCRYNLEEYSDHYASTVNA